MDEINTVGVRQTMRKLEKDQLEEVLIACDSDVFVTRPIEEAARSRNVRIKYIDSKKILGHICGIEIGTAVAGILRSETDSEQDQQTDGTDLI